MFQKGDVGSSLQATPVKEQHKVTPKSIKEQKERFMFCAKDTTPSSPFLRK